MNREQILEEIRRHFEETGDVPGIESFLRDHPAVPRTAFRGLHWEKWTDAVREAGLTPRQFTPATDEAVVFRVLAELTLSLGAYPTQPQLTWRRKSDPTIPLASSLQRRFGNRAQQIARLRAWCTSEPGFEDVAAICAHASDAVESIPEPEDLTEVKAGYVYLLHSKTRGYKIGMTSSMPRRWSEIENADPDDVELVHHFKTVDAAGIEAYWLRRFDAQRKDRGEWFSLLAKHVSEFKRRSKSM